MHTPLPWHNSSKNYGSTPCSVYGLRHADGGDYAALCTLRNEEDANLIVSSVNQHSALLKCAGSLRGIWAGLAMLKAAVEAGRTEDVLSLIEAFDAQSDAALAEWERSKA